ncbi:MAG: hypothetical protein ACE367_08995 [Acidimicrobiales bacterium]
MPKKRSTDTLRRKDRVRAATALRGVPEGTKGRVMMANGFTWPRYWVSFDNGVDMGSLGREKLVPDAEWKSFLKEREAAEKRALEAPDEAEATAADGDGGTAAGGSGGGATVNGVAVPQLLIDRTQAALQRFGVTR